MTRIEQTMLHEIFHALHFLYEGGIFERDIILNSIKTDTQLGSCEIYDLEDCNPTYRFELNALVGL